VSRSLKNIGVVSSATVISRILGLARDILVTAVFGASGLASAFVTAFTLPNLFRRLLGEGALTAALVPTLSDELAAGRRREALVIVNQAASWLGVVTLGIVAVAMLGFHLLADSAWLHGVSANVEQWQRWHTAAQLAVILFPYLVFVCMAAAFSAALQTFGRFAAPALSPIWLNLAMIGSLAWAVWGLELELDSAQMRWLCGGVLVGGFLQMAVPAIDLLRTGWRPRLDLRLSPAVKSILLLMGPTVLGSAVYLINLAVSRLIGLSLSESAAAILNLATRLVELPIGVFAIAVTTVVFPLISRHASEGAWDKMAADYRRGMRLILAINVPAAVGMALLAGPIIHVLFERGEFMPRDTAEMVPVLGMLAVGLPIFAGVSLLLRAFYAQKDTRTPVKAAVLSFVVNIGLALLLKDHFGTLGLAMASTVAVVVQALYLQVALTRRRPELGVAPLWGDGLKIMVAAAVMGLVVWLGGRVTDAWGETWLVDVIRLGLLIPIGAGTFAGLAFLLRLEGRDELLGLLRRRLAGRNTTDS
jgi:putative peptidoglycan lipid II flippase